MYACNLWCDVCMPGCMYICAVVVRTYGSEKAWEPSMMYLYLHASTKSFGSCVGPSRMCVIVCCALTTLFNHRNSANQCAFEDDSLCRCRMKSSSASASWFIVKCICLWVSRHARYASANARHEKEEKERRELAASFWLAQLLKNGFIE